MKSRLIAGLLWLVGIFGWLGLHRFYLRKTKTGVLWIFTGGMLGLGSLFDLLTLGEQVEQVNRTILLEKMAYSDCNPAQVETAMEITVKDFLQTVERLGINKNDFLTEQKELSWKFGSEINSSDVLWSLFKKCRVKMRDLDSLKLLDRAMAVYLKETGQNCFILLSRSHKRQLLTYQEEGIIQTVRISTMDGESCPACQKMEGKIYSVAEALEKRPLPCPECAYKLSSQILGFCRCRYNQIEDLQKELGNV